MHLSSQELLSVTKLFLEASFEAVEAFRQLEEELVEPVEFPLFDVNSGRSCLGFEAE